MRAELLHKSVPTTCALCKPKITRAHLTLRPKIGAQFSSKRLFNQSLCIKQASIVAMARTESVQLEEGTQAPDFCLPEPLTGKMVSLSDVRGSKATVVMIICNHCPFVIMLKQAIVQLANDYKTKGVGFVAISSNSVETHPQDGPEKMAEDAKIQGYPFPYL